jgi:hypothetical protein
MVRVLVTGDRNWTCDAVAAHVLAGLEERHGMKGFTIVHGDATGVDATFRAACEAMEHHHEPHPARWDDVEAPGARIKADKTGRAYNAAAGPIRNQEMVESGVAFAVAVHKNLGWSNGTRDCVSRCIAAGVKVYWISCDKVNPIRIVSGFNGRTVIYEYAAKKD